jgi:hypothetical protein
MAAVSDNYFLAEEPRPDPAAIAAALGDRLALYESLLEAASGFEREWKHYGKKYGWKLKVHDGAKALLELTIAPAEIRVSLAARESEMGALREAPAVAPILAALLPPGKSKEGWGIRMAVADAEGRDRARALIEALAGIRRAP